MCVKCVEYVVKFNKNLLCANLLCERFNNIPCYLILAVSHGLSDHLVGHPVVSMAGAGHDQLVDFSGDFPAPSSLEHQCAEIDLEILKPNKHR